MLKKKCLVCDETSFQKIYSGTLLRCSSCGFVTANMDVDEKILKKIYAEDYFKGEEYLNYVNDKLTIQKNFKARLNYIFNKIGGGKIKSVLEIGCAYGFFGETITNNISNIKYLGLDVSMEAVNYGKNNLKQNLICENYLSFKSDFYTDVFMWDVIEHLERPDLFLQKINNELDNGGRIYITTGDISGLIPRMKKQNWRMIHPPSHLQYFSAQTLSKLLNKFGFEIIDVSYPWIYRSARQIFYSLFLLNKNPNRVSKFIYDLIPEKLSLPLNTFDIMFVIAEKNYNK